MYEVNVFHMLLYVSDINECSDSSLHNCLATNFVKCVNLDHSFQCVCVNNFYMQIEKNRCIGRTRDVCRQTSILRSFINTPFAVTYVP